MNKFETSVLVKLSTIIILVSIACGQSKEEARQKLGELNVVYDERSFVEYAAKGDDYVVSLFLQAGMDPNTNNGRALREAAERGHDSVVMLLSEHKAIKTSSIYEAFDEAVREGQLSAAKILVNASTNIDTLLLPACSESEEVALFLLENGADVKVRNYYGKTALMAAAGAGHTELAKVLIQEGADVNAQTMGSGSYTPILYYSMGRTDNPELLRLLLEKGAKTNVRDDRGWTLLMFTADRGKIESTRLLTESGVDVNESDTLGVTPLMLAAKAKDEGKRVELVKLLIEKGADVNAKDHYGRRPLAFARGKVSQILRDAGALP